MIKHLTEGEFDELRVMMPHISSSEWSDRIEYIGVKLSSSEIEEVVNNAISGYDPISEMSIEEAIIAEDDIFDNFIEHEYEAYDIEKNLSRANLITKLEDERNKSSTSIS